MDEPLGALDAMTRMSMQDEIERLWQEKKKTIIFVTHDIEEAVFLADRIVIMTPSPGKVRVLLRCLWQGKGQNRKRLLKSKGQSFAEFELKPRDMTEYICKCF